ncbi:MAG: magnesium transporter [Phycisphaerales bacterium]|nr:magnesium transporter [Phycisphaerales bacterium]
MSQTSGNGEGLFSQLRELLARDDDDALRTFLADLHSADVADCLEQVEPEERSRIFFLLPPRTTAEAIVLLEEAVRSDVLDDLTDREVSDVLKELPADDAVDVLDELDDEKADKVVEHLPPERKAVVEPLRQYDEDTAGGIMNTDFISVPVTATVGDAIERIRRLTEEQRLDIYYIYCVDQDGKLTGVVPPLRLIASPPALPVEKLLLDDLFTSLATDDQEDVKNKFEKYDVVALPVVDEHGQMVGVVTHDDVLEVAEEEAEEDILHMAGTDAEEFATASIFRAAVVRARWLLPCLLGTFVGALIALYFQGKIGKEAYQLLIPFLIPIAAMGGNAGVQISTVIVRALATGDTVASRFRFAALREMRIALILGIGSGLFAGFGSFAVVNSGLMPGHDLPMDGELPLIRVAFSVGSAMTFAILLSGSLGLTMPFLFRRLGIDPAIATGPLITTVNDAVSAAIYLFIAMELVD